MSRVSLLEQLTVKRKSAFEFDFEKLWAPPIMTLFTPNDIQELIRIATSVRYNGNINKKYELIDAVMKRRGFVKAHSGTNRVVYNFLESSAFVAKVALDKVGMTDSPAEFINQQYFQPFCCKIFEVDPSGVIAFVERVNPISSIEEFASIADDIFNMMVTKIIGKYVVDDLGTRTFMNFGIRQNSNGHTFGPVIIDFPYVYEIDGSKLVCQTPKIDPATGMAVSCGGDIDYKPGFNGLYCTKCGREYKAMDLAKHTKDVKFEYDSNDDGIIKDIKFKMRARVIDNDKIIYDSGRSTNRYLTKEEFESMSNKLPLGEMQVDKTIRKKRQSAREFRNSYYTALQRQYYNELANKEKFNPVIKQEEVDNTVEVSKTIKNSTYGVFINDTVDDNQSANIGTEMVVDVTVDRFGNEITSTDILDQVKELEKQTFPELDNKTEYKPSIPTEDKIPDGTDLKDAEPGYYASDPIHPVFSDEDVERMAHENAMRNNDNNTVEVSNILDPDADKNPMGSPMIRPYAIAGGVVNVNHKITEDDVVPTEDDAIKAKQEAQAKIEEAEKLLEQEESYEDKLEMEEEEASNESDSEDIIDPVSSPLDITGSAASSLDINNGYYDNNYDDGRYYDDGKYDEYVEMYEQEDSYSNYQKIPNKHHNKKENND